MAMVMLAASQHMPVPTLNFGTGRISFILDDPQAPCPPPWVTQGLQGLLVDCWEAATNVDVWFGVGNLYPPKMLRSHLSSVCGVVCCNL